MSAASSPPPGPPTTPASGPAPAPTPATTAPGKTAAELAAEEVQDNALYRGMKSFWANLKAGKLLPSKILAVIIIVVVAGGLWWWFSGQSKKADSSRWAGLHNLVSSEELNRFAEENPNSTAALVSRRSRAINLLATEGTNMLKSRIQAERQKGIKNIEAARDELLALADLFKRDNGMRAACLADAALAERALVGVPKDEATTAANSVGGPLPAGPLATAKIENSRGNPAKVAEYYRLAATAIDEKTPSGQKFLQEAKDAEEKAVQLLEINSTLYGELAKIDTGPQPEKKTPTTVTDPKTNPNPEPNPKTPSTSFKTPTTKAK